MRSNDLDAKRLLKGVLLANTPEQAARAPQLSEERLRRHISGERPLNNEERALFLTSDADRERLVFVQQLMRAEALLKWRDREPRAPLALDAAAAETQIRPITFKRLDYSVFLTPIDARGEVWEILLEIELDLIQTSPAGFSLLDSEGLVWVSGHPNLKGELKGFWQRAESLWERIHQVELELQPA